MQERLVNDWQIVGHIKSCGLTFGFVNVETDCFISI